MGKLIFIGIKMLLISFFSIPMKKIQQQIFLSKVIEKIKKYTHQRGRWHRPGPYLGCHWSSWAPQRYTGSSCHSVCSLMSAVSHSSTADNNSTCNIDNHGVIPRQPNTCNHDYHNTINHEQQWTALASGTMTTITPQTMNSIASGMTTITPQTMNSITSGTMTTTAPVTMTTLAPESMTAIVPEIMTTITPVTMTTI